MYVENHPKWKATNIGGTHFPLPWLWEEGYCWYWKSCASKIFYFDRVSYISHGAGFLPPIIEDPNAHLPVCKYMEPYGYSREVGSSWLYIEIFTYDIHIYIYTICLCKLPYMSMYIQIFVNIQCCWILGVLEWNLSKQRNICILFWKLQLKASMLNFKYSSLTAFIPCTKNHQKTFSKCHGNLPTY